MPPLLLKTTPSMLLTLSCGACTLGVVSVFVSAHLPSSTQHAAAPATASSNCERQAKAYRCSTARKDAIAETSSCIQAEKTRCEQTGGTFVNTPIDSRIVDNGFLALFGDCTFKAWANWTCTAPSIVPLAPHPAAQPLDPWAPARNARPGSVPLVPVIPTPVMPGGSAGMPAPMLPADSVCSTDPTCAAMPGLGTCVQGTQCTLTVGRGCRCS